MIGGRSGRRVGVNEVARRIVVILVVFMMLRRQWWLGITKGDHHYRVLTTKESSEADGCYYEV